MTRLAALGLSHEANTFSPGRIDRDRLASWTVRGDSLVDQQASARSTMAGYLAAAEAHGVDVVPLIFARTTPSGPFTADAFDSYVDEMCDALATNGPWDGILLSLHGAAVAENFPDADGEILRRVRAVVGQDIPIGVGLDLHANVSELMVQHADVATAYQTNPHIDAYERAQLVSELIVRAARGEIRPTLAMQQIPAVIDILRQLTDAQPMADLLATARAAESQAGVLSTSVVEGFPYADVQEMGMSVLVVTDGDAELAQTLADELAREVWHRREDLTGTAATAAEAIARAAAAERTPVLLLDVGDNVGGGSPGDSIVLLAEARRQRLLGLLSIIQDPAAAAACHAAGVGARVDLEIGGRLVDETGPPLAMTVVVRALHDGPYEDAEATHGGQRYFNTGPTALVEHDDDGLLIVTSRPEIPSGLAQSRCLGVEPTLRRAIVAKGVQSPLAGYGPIAAEVIQVDTPGVTSADLHRLTYRHRRSPLYPFDDFPEEQS